MAGLVRVTEVNPDVSPRMAIAEALAIASIVRRGVMLCYLGVEMLVAPKSNPGDVLDRYERRHRRVMAEAA